MKIVYDVDETDLKKKCYIIKDDGEKVYLIDWNIKITEPSGWQHNFKLNRKKK